MTTPKVSVVVPVYNVGRYIEKGVRSLFSQTFDDLEFIFIDDKTPDDSIEILERVLEEYPDRKDQVKIIRHEQNKGVSQSRQDGVNAATGEYIIHFDPDDWTEPDMYEKLYNKAKETNADITGCDIVFENKYYSKIRKQNFNLKRKEIVSGILQGKQINSFLWGRLIKREFILNSNIKFDKNAYLWEDMLYLTQLHSLTDKVAYIPEALYHYRINTDSITFKKRNTDYIDKALYVTDKLKEIFSDPVNKESIEKRKLYLLFYFATNIHDYKPKIWKEYYKNQILEFDRKSLNNQQKKVLSLLRQNHDKINYLYLLWINLPEMVKEIIKKILYPKNNLKD